ncbi:unnamed protein product [Protopolystoma xenopodis]|uniref:Uncharacterized protein n=1 Tax=Protopolystoma xenopodis TaxID=117903 RepID=A0A448WM65_9PLAT|nr:unnamed protein product [Protopolystoma xenopodis]
METNGGLSGLKSINTSKPALANPSVLRFHSLAAPAELATRNHDIFRWTEFILPHDSIKQFKNEGPMKKIVITARPGTRQDFDVRAGPDEAETWIWPKDEKDDEQKGET